MMEAFEAGADAVLAASIFHDGETTVANIKKQLATLGISVRQAAAEIEQVRREQRATAMNRQCLVPSIDIMGGNAVQLVGGDPNHKKVDAGDPVALAEQFRLVGEIAVVDLDAALGRGNNTQTIKKLLSVAPCRVGGGIRTIEKAMEWLNAGAVKVVIGTAAKPEFLRQLPRERVVVALDARHGEVVVEGWQTSTGKNVKDCIRELAPYAGGFLITFVEREGRMAGIDLVAIEELIEELQSTPFGKNTQITIAGGITTEADLAALDDLGVEGQVGMALYTGRIDLGDAISATLRSDRPDGLFVTVIADERGTILGLAHSSKESIKLSLKERRAIFCSLKGETSGDILELIKVEVNCGRDMLLFTVQQTSNGFCNGLVSQKKPALEVSYGKHLFNELKAKLSEKATELAEAEDKDHVANEAADLFNFALTACANAGVTLSDLEHALESRALNEVRRNGDAKKPFADANLAKQQLDLENYESKRGEEKEKEEAAKVSLKRLRMDEVWDLRRDVVDKTTRDIVEVIMKDVREKGEEALISHSMRLGDLKSKETPYLLTRDDMKAAFVGLTPEQRSLLQRTADRIRAFAIAQKGSLHTIQVPIAGGRAGHTVAAVEVAGCYAPGGRYPLPSSVLMTAITARTAGCKQVLVASPNPQPITLAAAYVAEADSLLAVGGAQAIAAFAYGISGKIPSCDAIVGPGNKFVTAAKSLVAGRVSIDILAGPSECLVLADSTALPDVVAADLIAQAEHDVSAVPILVAFDEETVCAVEREVEQQLCTLPTADTARAAFVNNGFAVVVSNQEEAISVCDKIAPEHLEVHTANAAELANKLKHYGALFIGNASAEVFGDYGAGPNHTLPTSGTGRSFGGLSVLSFLRVRTWLDIDDIGSTTGQQLVQDAVDLALLEGLHGHARSAQKRLVAATSDAATTSAEHSTALLAPMPREPVTINFALPKGRMMDSILALLKDAGIKINVGGRNLRPSINMPGWTVKLLKPRNVVEMIHHGTRDIGFAGIDLLKELGADDVVPYFDTGLDPVRVVVAAPEKLLVNGKLPKRHLRLATEYVSLAEQWVKENEVDAEIYRTFGSTEVFPPDDAEVIVDNTATGSTLQANQLSIVDVITNSSTFLCANRNALEDPYKRAALDELVILLQSALNARDKTLIEFEVHGESLQKVISGLPSMKKPTISTLFGGEYFAVRSVIPRKSLVNLIPWIKANGGSDVIVTEIKQVVI